MSGGVCTKDYAWIERGLEVPSKAMQLSRTLLHGTRKGDADASAVVNGAVSIGVFESEDRLRR